jgi:hypothetical protein
MPTMPPATATQSRGAFPNRRVTLIVLSILTLPYILGLVVATTLAWASPLVILDGPADAGAWPVFCMFCTSPIIFIIGIFGGWLSFFLKRYRLALILTLLPLLEICVFLFGILFVEGF